MTSSLKGGDNPKTTELKKKSEDIMTNPMTMRVNFFLFKIFNKRLTFCELGNTMQLKMYVTLFMFVILIKNI